MLSAEVRIELLAVSLQLLEIGIRLRVTRTWQREMIMLLKGTRILLKVVEII
jgi:hypothetical protein